MPPPSLLQTPTLHPTTPTTPMARWMTPPFVFTPTETAADRPAKRRARRARRAIVLVLLWLVGAGVSSALHHRVTSTRTIAEVTPAHPAEWDSRVSDLVGFVQDHRGLKFQHPIDVQFMAEDDFVALFDHDAPPSGSDEADQAAQGSALLDATGLVSDSDVAAATDQLRQVTTLGFYDFRTDKVYVRGNVVTPALRVILVHELTHALQAQWFDIHLGGADDLTVRAVVEGDAMRIEDEYTASLPGADQTQAIDGTTADPAAHSQLEGVPWAVIDASYAPYVLGPMFVRAIEQQGGNVAVNAVFHDFPTQRELITPEDYGDGVHEVAVRAPSPAGLTVIEPERAWGEFDALVMLDAWLPWRIARDPFDGWRGGGYMSYERTDLGTACFSTTASFDSPAHADGYSAAVAAWALAAGSGAVPTTANGTDVSFEACERPAGAAFPPKPLLSTSESIYLERLIAGELDLPDADVGAGIDRCIARTLIDDPLMSPVFAASTLTDDLSATLMQRRDRARWDCTAAVTATSVPPAG